MFSSEKRGRSGWGADALNDNRALKPQAFRTATASFCDL